MASCHLAPQMNEAHTGHNMDLELNLRDWIHFLKADVLVTDGSFSNVVGALRDNVDPSNGFPLTFQYCKLGFRVIITPTIVAAILTTII